jgi:hypothetical protein
VAGDQDLLVQLDRAFITVITRECYTLIGSASQMQLISSTSVPVPLKPTLPFAGFVVLHELEMLAVSRHWQKLVFLTHKLRKTPTPLDTVTLPLHPL